MDFMAIIDFFYREHPALREKLLSHSRDVCRKALEIADNSSVTVDRNVVTAGAMLHDIGIFRCHAPSILCLGDEPYLRHGLIGGNLLRRYGKEHDLDLDSYARGIPAAAAPPPRSSRKNFLCRRSICCRKLRKKNLFV